MKHRILKKFVKAYRPYGTDREGIRIGIKEELKAKCHEYKKKCW